MAILQIKTRVRKNWYNIGSIVCIIKKSGLYAFCQFEDGETGKVLLVFLKEI